MKSVTWNVSNTRSLLSPLSILSLSLSSHTHTLTHPPARNSHRTVLEQYPRRRLATPIRATPRISSWRTARRERRRSFATRAPSATAPPSPPPPPLSPHPHFLPITTPPLPPPTMIMAAIAIPGIAHSAHISNHFSRTIVFPTTICIGRIHLDLRSRFSYSSVLLSPQ